VRFHDTQTSKQRARRAAWQQHGAEEALQLQKLALPQAVSQSSIIVLRSSPRLRVQGVFSRIMLSL